MMNPVAKGIDISHWQGAIDFARVKQQGFSFAIIRATAGNKNGVLYADENFENYYVHAKNAGLHVGTYHYASGQFHRPGWGVKEAEHFYNAIKGKSFEYPVVLDVECSPAGYKDATTQNTIEFCNYLENLGYYVAIYASDLSGFKERLNLSALVAYDKWVARYNTTGPHYVTDFGMWQFGGSTNYISNVKVQGVSSAACDQNFAYKNYPQIIKNAGLNGFDKTNGHNLYNFSAGPVSKGDLQDLCDLAAKQGVPFEYSEVR